MVETYSFPAWLTIDDAPSPDSERKLAALASREIKAIWFCRGEYLVQWPNVALNIVKAGHVIGNHSWNHPAFKEMRLTKIRSQIQRTEEQIDLVHARAGIARPARLFRFPWGDKGGGTHMEQPMSQESIERVGAIQDILREFGFTQPVFDQVDFPAFPSHDVAAAADTWFTFDAMEWALVSRKPRENLRDLDSILSRIDAYFEHKRVDPSRIDRGEVILVHDFEATASTFVPIIDRLVANGARFVDPEDSFRTPRS